MGLTLVGMTVVIFTNTDFNGFLRREGAYLSAEIDLVKVQEEEKVIVKELVVSWIKQNNFERLLFVQNICKNLKEAYSKNK